MSKFLVAAKRNEAALCSFVVNPPIDPSAVLRTTVRAGPNGADRVLVDKDRRVLEIFPEFPRPVV